MVWLGLMLCTVLIIYSGSRLSRYGDIIADKLRIGKVWMGVMMASVTSLPELVTGVSAVTFAKAPNIAIGDVLAAAFSTCLFFRSWMLFIPNLFWAAFARGIFCLHASASCCCAWY